MSKRVPVYLSEEELNVVFQALANYEHDGLLDYKDDEGAFIDRLNGVISETLEQFDETK